MKAITDFTARVGANLSLDADFTLERERRYFLLNKRLLKLVPKDFYYAGTYLGKVKKGRFFPSFNLLAILGKCDANRIVIDKKAAWLFICGRDVFREGVITIYGSRRRGSFTLVLNEFRECLGFGRITDDLDSGYAKVVVRNVSDVGDFLRRER